MYIKKKTYVYIYIYSLQQVASPAMNASCRTWHRKIVFKIIFNIYMYICIYIYVIYTYIYIYF